MNRTRWTLALIGLIGLGAMACGGGEDAPAGDAHGDMPMGQPMEGMEGMHGAEDMSAMMTRHAQEADSMATVVRQHAQELRQLPADEWHERMGEHVTRVSQMLNLMNRQMREMDMGMGMSDDQMGEMMGRTGEEHRGMMEEMRALRTDLEQLQTASRDEVRDRMPDHLERLERMVDMLEASARHMRTM